MTRTLPDFRTVAEVEGALGIDSLDALLAERARLVGINARLAAMYGPFGTWDATRKKTLAVIALGLRDKANTLGERVTDKAIDERSHADPRYINFLDISTTEKANYLVNEDSITAIEARIHSRQAMLRFAASEVRL